MTTRQKSNQTIKQNYNQQIKQNHNQQIKTNHNQQIKTNNNQQIKTNNNQQIKQNHNYQLWCHCMSLGEKTGCHQLPERSFFIKGYQFPICARCTGVVIGYLFALPLCLMGYYKRIVSIICCGIMFFDWFLQASNIKKSSNRRRLITGILGGYGIISVQYHLIYRFWLFLCDYFKTR